MRNADIQAQPTLFSVLHSHNGCDSWVLALRTWLKRSVPGEHGQMSMDRLRGLSFSLCGITGQRSAAATPPPAGGSALTNKRSQPSLSLFDFSYRFFSHTGLICSPCANRDIAFWTAQYQMQSECWAVVCQHCPLLISHCFFFLSTKGTQKGCVNAEFAYLWLQTVREPKTCLSLSLPCFSLFVSLLLTESHLHSSCKPGDWHALSKQSQKYKWDEIQFDKDWLPLIRCMYSFTVRWVSSCRRCEVTELKSCEETHWLTTGLTWRLGKGMCPTALLRRPA